MKSCITVLKEDKALSLAVSSWLNMGTQLATMVNALITDYITDRYLNVRAGRVCRIWKPPDALNDDGIASRAGVTPLRRQLDQSKRRPIGMCRAQHRNADVVHWHARRRFSFRRAAMRVAMKHRRHLMTIERILQPA